VGLERNIPEHNMICINPEIIKVSRKKVHVPEGCLSVRWFYGNTVRNEKATIRAYDENGKLFTYGGSGLVAQIFQHETDHLNGTLFIDHATDIEELTEKEIAAIEAKSALSKKS
jgi:peptide deformylase